MGIVSNYFVTTPGSPYVTCKICDKNLKCWSVGSKLDLSSIYRHFRSKHQEVKSQPTGSSHPTSSTFADREKELDVFLNKQTNPSEVNGYVASSFVKPPADLAFAESEYPLSEDTVSPSSRESPLLEVEHSTLSELEVPEGSYGLYSSEIINILERCPVTSKYFKGVKTRDIPIPRLFELENNEFAAYIVNTGYARAGVHWVLALFTPSYNIFFDSFGRSPSELFLETQVKQINTSILYNTKRLQHSKSHVCGHWTIYYTYFLSQGLTLSEINSRFSSSNFSMNDKIVFNFVKNLAMSCKAPLERYEYATKKQI